MPQCVLGTMLTRTEVWFGHGCSSHRILVEHERNYGLGMNALVTVFLGTRTELWFGRGCVLNIMLNNVRKHNVRKPGKPPEGGGHLTILYPYIYIYRDSIGIRYTELLLRNFK